MKVDTVRGIGVDIEEVARFKKVMKNMVFLKRVFTKDEISYCRRFAAPEQHLAARFAAKEATIKALGDIGKGLGLNEIEILNRRGRAPVVNMRNKRLKKLSYFISLSHSDDKAIAFSVVIGKIKI